MIHRNKTNRVPNSLQLPARDNDKRVTTRENGVRKTTDARRKEVIRKRKFIDEKVFRDRYKQSDVKTALKDLYERKCCYCERRKESFDIEHYRPTSIYYWLSYSWDNLLFVWAL